MSELTERFIDLREDGKTLREIAVITGANYYYVREICRKNKAGIRIQPKKKACTKEMERIPVQPTERTCLYCGKTFFAKGIKKYCSETPAYLPIPVIRTIASPTLVLFLYESL